MTNFVKMKIALDAMWKAFRSSFGEVINYSNQLSKYVDSCNNESVELNKETFKVQKNKNLKGKHTKPFYHKSRW